jgi:hypothetical protein
LRRDRRHRAPTGEEREKEKEREEEREEERTGGGEVGRRDWPQWRARVKDRNVPRWKWI